MSKYPYTKQELYTDNSQRKFNGDASEAAFLLGGIGTGNFSIGARGEFRDWEIFNRPGKGNKLPYTFFAIWAKPHNKEPICRVLESELQPPFSKSHGFKSDEIAGLPRLDLSTMKGEYPFIWIDFQDKKLPVKVSLEAFTPFIPLNTDDSGVPGVILRYKVKNTTDKKMDVSIAGSLPNVVGFNGYNLWNRIEIESENKNEYRDDGEIRGLFYSSKNLKSEDLQYGNLAFMTPDSSVTYKENWLDGGWFDGIHDFWDDFKEDGKIEKESVFEAQESFLRDKSNIKMGSLGIYHTLEPGEEKFFEFVITWYFPNRVKAWDEDYCCSDCDCKMQTIKNYYSTLFDSAWDAGKYLINNLDKLEGKTREFHQALFGSSLPGYILDAIASNITVIRSPTCFRIENGTFLGWEGCFDQKGCCPGSCTHVWNYAQTLAFLFPELEQSMRMVEFNLETDEEGKMAFRTTKVFGNDKLPKWDMLPAADGQMGTIIRLYRDWKISGNDELLNKVWEKASKALDFAFDYWDQDGDFVLDSQQHNTYDIEFYGPNSLTNSMFFAGLKAGIEMAKHLGDQEHVKKYKEALDKGSKKMDELLWGGKYYIQQIDDVNKYRYQYGKGCLSDQLLGQFLSHVAGLGYILPEEHVKEAVNSIFKYNFRTSFKEHENVERTYALNDEKGLLLCSWPEGGRPKLPFVYSDEVWTGIEYQVASHLIYEGYIDEGLTIVKSVRERHDGYRRNPWNEVECGHHYARSMASWGLLLALSGFKYDMLKGTISFKPKINEDNFTSFWSTGKAWGIYRQKKDKQSGEIKSEIEILYGEKDSIRLITD